MHDAALAALRDGRYEDAARVIESSLPRERETIRTLRDLSFAIEPVVLRDRGFHAAVRALGDQIEDSQQITVGTDVEAGEQLGEKAQVALYQIIRESLNQAVPPPARADRRRRCARSRRRLRARDRRRRSGRAPAGEPRGDRRARPGPERRACRSTTEGRRGRSFGSSCPPTSRRREDRLRARWPPSISSSSPSPRATSSSSARASPPSPEARSRSATTASASRSAKIGPSPLPEDERLCAYLQRAVS